MNLFTHIRNWNTHRKAVRDLSRLSDRMLADIGIERNQIQSAVYGVVEISKPVVIAKTVTKPAVSIEPSMAASAA